MTRRVTQVIHGDGVRKRFETAGLRRHFTTGVSLHSHTCHSREALSDLPAYMARIPLVAGRPWPIDFSRGWWHPPVDPRGVFESESLQIEQRLGLSPLVSVTDHDSIAAGLELQNLFAPSCAPISFEWTVPYDAGYFHLGIHDLPPADATSWFDRLERFTTAPAQRDLGELFERLHAQPGILVVFNHPMWDLACVGADRHQISLTRFLDAHGHHLHAVELNGYRDWRENERVMSLAASTRLPLISGGDRHGCAPNALLNLTSAASFAEFVREVRDGHSIVAVMPEYRQHIFNRKLATVADVVRRYHTHPSGRREWTDRVSCPSDDAIRPLSYHWPDGGPWWIRCALGAVRCLSSPVVRPVLGAGLHLKERWASRLELGGVR